MDPLVNLIIALAIIFDIFMIIFIILNVKKNKTTYWLLSSIVFLLIWSSLSLYIFLITNPTNSLPFQKIKVASGFIFSALFFMFLVSFTKFRLNNLIIPAFFSITGFLAASSFASNLIVKGVRDDLVIIKGPLYFLTPVFMSTIMITGFIMVMVTYIKTNEEKIKNISKLILIFYFIPLIMGIPIAIFSFLKIDTFLQHVPMPSISSTILIALITYALLKYDF